MDQEEYKEDFDSEPDTFLENEMTSLALIEEKTSQVMQLFREENPEALKKSILDLLEYSYADIKKRIITATLEGKDDTEIQKRIDKYFKRLETMKKLSEKSLFLNMRVSSSEGNSLLNLLQ